MKRWIIILMAISLSVGATPRCYGSFALTRTLHDWIGSLENKWLSELVFFVLAVWPLPLAYALAILADAIVLNSVEFWTGENPVGQGADRSDRRTDARTAGSDGQAPYRRTIHSGSARAEFLYAPGGQTLEIRVFDQERAVQTMVLRRDRPGEIFVPRQSGAHGDRDNHVANRAGRADLVRVDVQALELDQVSALQVREDGMPTKTRLVPSQLVRDFTERFRSERQALTRSY